jgi:hypothetical protein
MIRYPYKGRSPASLGPDTKISWILVGTLEAQLLHLLFKKSLLDVFQIFAILFLNSCSRCNKKAQTKRHKQTGRFQSIAQLLYPLAIAAG